MAPLSPWPWNFKQHFSLPDLLITIAMKPKELSSVSPFPRSFSSIVVLVGGFALFLIVASWFLILNPLSPTIQSNFISVDLKSALVDLNINQTQQNSSENGHQEVQGPSSNQTEGLFPQQNSSENGHQEFQGSSSNQTAGLFPQQNSSENGPSSKQISSSQFVSLHDSKPMEKIEQPLQGFSNDSKINVTNEDYMPPSNSNKTSKVDPRSCDLCHGKWFYDPSGPLYTNNSCPIITETQNCQGNGRPDKDYENWRWKPAQCDLPRFDAKKFLELMKRKTVAFIGDSVARNQMESLLCLLWQVEKPTRNGSRRMQRWIFRSTRTVIIRVWSSWLVHSTLEPFQFAPGKAVKLHLDAPDEQFMDLLPRFDVVVLSSGHWFSKQSVYILNNEIVGGQLWWTDKTREMKVNNIRAFGISTETALSAIASHPNYTGLTIVRSYSPDHYVGGAWNSGGSCTGISRPASEKELVANGFTDAMYQQQVTGFKNAIEKVSNKSRLMLMDITEMFSYRVDGHPGPYRSRDPHKMTTRGPNGKAPPQDCLHWCMPGAVDTLNEIVFEILRREFKGSS